MALLVDGLISMCPCAAFVQRYLQTPREPASQTPLVKEEGQPQSTPKKKRKPSRKIKKKRKSKGTKEGQTKAEL
eukprot:SAG25_NODE_386_length_8683_cov_36.568150_6_plen_74_part_00